MRRTPITIVILCAAILGACLGLPAGASASSHQLAVFEDNARLSQEGAATRDATLNELRGLGVDVIKVQVPWADAAPGGRTKPKGFNSADPAQYPGWDVFDGVVSAAQARGFRVMLALGPPAPGWATRKHGDLSGVDQPSAKEYGRYIEAAGRHFSSVDLWTFWNEPNHPGFLYPQATKSRIPYSPRLYRALVRAGADGLKRAGHGRDRILFGELLPIGKQAYFKKNTIKPLRFLREFFCVSRSGRPLRGHTAKVHGCNGYKRLTGVNGFAYHPYTQSAGPNTVEPSRDDATIRSISRITAVLDSARRHGRIGGGKLSVWNTEFGYQSDPPDVFQARLSRIPGFINQAEWMSYRNRRVATYSQYTLIDDPLGKASIDRYGSWQGGLRFTSGKAKPGVYDAYRLPLFVRLLGPSHVEVWGDARPSGAGGTAQVQQRSGKGGYAVLGGPITVKNSRGYFVARFTIAKAAKRTFRFVSGGRASRATKAVAR